MAVVDVIVVVGKRRDGARYEKVEGAEAPAGAGKVEGIAPRLFRNQCFGQTRRGGRLADWQEFQEVWCETGGEAGQESTDPYTDMGPSDVFFWFCWGDCYSTAAATACRIGTERYVCGWTVL